MGKGHSKMDKSTLRDAMRQVYGQLKRNKALPENRGISLAVVDNHEGHTSYLQQCSGCLSREPAASSRNRRNQRGVN